MSNITCNKDCMEFKAKKTWKGGRYAAGQVYCSKCNIYMNYEGRDCPCCGIRVRHKLREKSHAERYRAKNVGDIITI